MVGQTDWQGSLQRTFISRRSKENQEFAILHGHIKCLTSTIFVDQIVPRVWMRSPIKRVLRPKLKLSESNEDEM